MQYLEDIIELVEDLPHELERRFDQVRRWDQDVERLRLECKDLQKRIFDEERHFEIKEKNKMIMELAEKQHSMYEITEKKLDMANRSERLMMAILEKVNEGAYHCKIELEVDNPGCTDSIERNFCNMLGLRPATTHLTDCTMEFEPLESDACSVQSAERGTPPPQVRDVLKERTNKGKGDRSHVSNTMSIAKKYKKKDKNASVPPMTNYMRKKYEKKREAQKLLEVHARREEERKRSAMSNHVPQLDTLPFETKPLLKTPKLEEPSTHVNGDMEDGMSWADGLGSDDDFDANEALGLFPSMLPSPPREIMESLKEEGMFAFDDELMGVGSSRSQMPSPSSYNDLHHSPSVDGHMTPRERHPSMSSSQLEMDKKKKHVMFGSLSDTSMHGRPRKLTDRAVELLQMGREKGRKRDDDPGRKWCYCKEVSSGQMIQCESPGCSISWFHFECVGVTTAPSGDWYCPQCSLRLIT